MTKEREESRKALISMEDELRAIYSEFRKEREPGEFTIPEFAEANGIPNKAAENFICRGVIIGLFTKREKIFIDGRFRTVYKKVEK